MQYLRGRFVNCCPTPYMDIFGKTPDLSPENCDKNHYFPEPYVGGQIGKTCRAGRTLRQDYQIQ